MAAQADSSTRTSRSGAVQTRGAILREPGTNSGWQVEDIEIDPPKEGEVLIKLTASGMCHSDDHVNTGDIPLDWGPIIGGHEGAGVIEAIGPNVRDLQPGDHVITTFLPSCGHCRFCVSGTSNLCGTSAGVLAGTAPDGTHRIHLSDGTPVGPFSYLGTFSPYCCAPALSVMKIDPSIPLQSAALIGCGVPTGWGSAVYAAETQIGDTVVVIGTGGVGMNAVQGARHAGAEQIVAVEPVEWKREKAREFGATHVAANLEEALDLVMEITHGVGSDRAIITVGVGYGNLLNPAQMLVRKGGTLVFTSAAPLMQRDVEFDLYTFAMSNKRLQGTLYGSVNPRVDVPRLLGLYRSGQLKLDELITRTYTLDEINQGWTDLEEGRNLRGVLVFD
jgi:S-(hydroxymethyl)glutathione dehydrogenase/alcohol dehydrogenase